MSRTTERVRPVVITGADLSGDDQLRARKIRYALMMAIRVVCLIGAMLTIHVFWPVAAAFVLGVVALPWCAVLLANDRPAKKKDSGFRGHIPTGEPITIGELESNSPPPRTIDL